MLSLVRILQEPVKSLRSSLNAPFALCHSIFTQPFAAILECALFIERLLLYEFLRKLMSLSSFLFLDFFNALVVSVAVFFLDLLPQRLELRNVVILFIQAHCKVIWFRVHLRASAPAQARAYPVQRTPAKVRTSRPKENQAYCLPRKALSFRSSSF